MKIFISWSGEISGKVARILRDWLPYVLPTIKPYVSSEDIEKGTAWNSDIASQIETAIAGIICVTKDNINSPWLNFEAGALFKSLSKSSPKKVCPFLFGLTSYELKGPLNQFQLTNYEKQDIQKLVVSLNNSNPDVDSRIDSNRLVESFNVWWPKLEESLELVYKLVNRAILWMLETKEINIESEILSLSNEGFKNHVKCFFKESRPINDEYDFCICVFNQTISQVENIKSIIEFLKLLKHTIPLIVYTRFIPRRLEENEIALLQEYGNFVLANMPHTLKNHFMSFV